MSRNSQRGSAIIMILIAVALFAALAYAFTQGSRTSTSWLEKEASKASTTQDSAYTQTVNIAVKRLKLRGCTDAQISYETPKGYYTNANAPADGTCHVYKLAGGGVQFRGDDLPPADPCTTAAIGAVCTDGAIYIGTTGGNRIYAASANEGSTLQWKTANNTTTGTDSTADGKANTTAMIAAGAAAHPAANACNNKAPSGTWYLPAKDELLLVWTNRVAIGLAARGFLTGGQWSWSSTQNTNPAYAWLQRFNDGGQNFYSKTDSNVVRCVRR